MNNLLAALQGPLGFMRGARNFFTAPNPYPNLLSPIPSSDQITRQLAPGFVSPIAQQDVIPHPAGPSAFQAALSDAGRAIDMAKQTGSQWANAFGFGNSAPQANVLSAQANNLLTPTPTQVPSPTPTSAFQNIPGFSTTPVPSEYVPLIIHAAQRAGVHPALLSSILWSESGLNPTASNSARTASGQIIPGNYDRGIAQINSVAHPEISDQQANNPQFAIPWAANLLAGYLRNLGINRGIAAYNVGQGGAQIQGSMPFGGGPKGQAYINKIGVGLTPELRQQLGIQMGGGQ